MARIDRRRLAQTVLVGSTIGLSWLGMMVVHEAGHVAAGWLTGGSVSRVVLHPLAISRTDLSHNPRPLIVAWAGPALGVCAPLLAWLAWRSLHWPGAHLLRFFAGFCFLANGAYLGFGSFDGVGDAGDLLKHGALPWQLWLFGAVCCPSGLALWHRLGPYFGLGKSEGRVSVRAAYICLALLLLTAAAELAVSLR